MKLTLNPGSIDDYRRFLQIKALPVYDFRGREAWFPDEYAAQLGIETVRTASVPYEPLPGLFDYQRDISALAIKRRKYAVFAECGLGKTLILLEFARHVHAVTRGRFLILSPLMVVNQTVSECQRFYSDSLKLEILPSGELANWMEKGSGIAITNYEALKNELPHGKLSGIGVDESDILKSHYGKYGQQILKIGAGCEWKICGTGTPAPNDRIEYANHAVFLDSFPTVNSFLARFFVNRGQTGERWELKPHALKPFYRALSHWCIFLTDPSVYGWKDNCETIPPMEVSIEHVDLTPEQQLLIRKETGQLIATKSGGITGRGKLSQIAKGHWKGQYIATNKPAYIRSLVNSWPDESTIIWCLYDEEQRAIERQLPDAGSIGGWTKHEDRMAIIEGFKARKIRTLISKAKVLGRGLNLQVCTRMVFSALVDSYQDYWQCIKRANRYGSTRPLRIHIPVTDVEIPMVETVLQKAKRVQADTNEQERLFKDCGHLVFGE